MLGLVRPMLFGLALAVVPLGAQAFHDTEDHAAAAAIMSAGDRAATIRQLGDVPSIGVVNLAIRHTLRLRSDDTDAAEYRILSSKYANRIATLRAALQANPVTRKALMARGIAINRVVGVTIGSNGSLRLYVLWAETSSRTSNPP